MALLLISYFNPLTVRGSGAFLLTTGVTVAMSSWVASVPIGWELVAILAVWGAYELVRLGRRDRGTTSQADQPVRQPEMAGRR